MAFSSKEIQEHLQEVTSRQVAKPTRLPSLDDYDRMSWRSQGDGDFLDQDEDGYDVTE